MRWRLRTPDPTLVGRLASAASLDPVIAGLLLQRGVGAAAEAERFLHPRLEHLHSPFRMAGMRPALERLLAAIERKEKVLIYGDYDVDGTTAVVILKVAIELCGGVATFHVPHRIRDGYGMKEDVIEHAAADGVRLIISVDTGIRAFSAAETARRVGVDLIVTDHHLAGDAVPDALVVLNPNQPGCDYPCKALCGAGVAFKLIQALLEKTGRERLLPSFLRMVAIATVADAVPLVDENRVIAKLGLDGLRSAVNPGLKALLEVAQLDNGKRLTAGDVAFRLAPRLNAAGRMDVAQDVIALFTTQDAAQARDLAARLNQLNAERQQEEKKICEQIDQRLAEEPALRQAYCIVVDGEGWHRGVIGIAATRMVERYCRPALVVARDGPEAHGSGRSISSFHLHQALESCAHLFTRFGGHAHAVGFGLPSARIPELRAALDAYARTCLTPADFEPALEIDGEVELAQVTPELYRVLQQLEPFGMDNPEPVFAARNLRLALPARVLKEKHLKLRVVQDRPRNDQACHPDPERREGEGPASRGFDALGWRMAERLATEPLVPNDRLDLAFTLDYNDHADFGGLQLVLRDYKKASAAAR